MPFESTTSERALQYKYSLCEDCNEPAAAPSRYWDGLAWTTRVLCLRCSCTRMVTGQDDLYAKMIEAEARAGLGARS